MTMEELRSLLGCCSAINLGLLIFSTIFRQSLVVRASAVVLTFGLGMVESKEALEMRTALLKVTEKTSCPLDAMEREVGRLFRTFGRLIGGGTAAWVENQPKPDATAIHEHVR